MDLSQVISAVLAGGLAGQITTLLLGSRYTAKRDFNNWLRIERFKVFSEFLALVSATISRSDYDSWPDEVRTLSQKIHLLYPEGIAPPQVSEGMEKLFQLVLWKKLGKVKNDKQWRHKMREESRELRREFAKTLHR